MTAFADTLAGHSFFTGMAHPQLERLAGCATAAEYPAGAWIARAGAPADRFHAVLVGRAGVEISAAGRDPLLVATVHPGEVVGWSWFVEPHEWHFDVVSLDAVRSLAIDAEALREACRLDHELGYEISRRLTRVVASRLESTRHQLVDVYGRPR